MTDRTPMQRALDAEALVADLAKRVEVLEATLKPFSDFAGELFARNNMAQDPVAMLTPDDPHGKYHKVTAGDFFAARKALSTPSVGESLAEENERLREALRPFAQVAEHDIGSDEADGDTYRPMDVRYANAEPIKVGHLRRAFAVLSGKDRT